MTSFAQNGLLLDVQHVTMRFGGITAVNDLSMRIPTGSITGLIGPNGAGKTTAFNVISGFYNPQEGDILFKGHSVKGFPPHRICRAGMARTFQNIRLFGSETALENVMVGCQVRRKSQWWMPVFSLPNARREEEEIREKAKGLIHRLALDSYMNEKASSLPYGAQRRLEIARALATDILFMEQGKIIEQGAPDVLLAPGSGTRTSDFCGKLFDLRGTEKSDEPTVSELLTGDLSHDITDDGSESSMIPDAPKKD